MLFNVFHEWGPKHLEKSLLIRDTNFLFCNTATISWFHSWYTLKNAVSAEYEMGKRRNINLNFNHKFGYLAAIFLCVHMTWWPCLRFLDSSPCCDIWNSSTKLGSVTWSTSRMKGSKIHLGLSKLIITHYKKKPTYGYHQMPISVAQYLSTPQKGWMPTAACQMLIGGC